MGPTLATFEPDHEDGGKIPCWMTADRLQAEAQAALLVTEFAWRHERI